MDINRPAKALSKLGADRRNATLSLAASAAFLVDALLVAAWEPPEDIITRIALTSAGEALADAIQGDGLEASPAEVRLAALIVFSSPDALLVDDTRTDADFVTEWLSGEVRNRGVQFPWLLGGSLHAAYASTIGRFATTLTASDTQRLLEPLPQGVFQFGALVSGPFGVLRADTSRHIPPTRSVSAFECDRPRCTELHHVLLSTEETGTGRAFTAIARALKASPDGAASLLRAQLEPGLDVSPRAASTNLPFLLGDCFSDAELTGVAARGLDRHAEQLRGALRAGGLTRKAIDTSSAALADTLSRAEIVQILTLLPDQRLTALLDGAVRDGTVTIPGVEVRAPRTSLQFPAIFGNNVAISRHGIRLGSTALAGVRLHELVRFVHRTEGTDEDLEWKLRGTRGETTSERLQRLLHQTLPTKALEDLILVSRRHARAALKFPGLESATMHIDEDPAELARILAWKLGFDVSPADDALHHFSRRLESFRDVAATFLASPGSDEPVKDRVRSEGVNFFVSVEQLLELTVSFSTWGLLHDHVADGDPFTYNSRTAKQCMLDVLSGRRLRDTSVMTFPSDANLTLGTLSQAFTALLGALADVAAEPKKYERTRLPEWVDKTPLLDFPFRHTRPVLDISEESQQSVVDVLRDVPTTLATADVAGVRNRIDHWREEAHAGRDFPSGAEIQTVCDAVQQLVGKLVAAGLCPAVLELVRRTDDAFSRSRLEFADEAGRSLTLYEPNALMMCGLPRSRRQVAMLVARLAGHSDVLRFCLVESSPYSDLWRDFPPVRLAHPAEAAEIETSVGGSDLPRDEGTFS